MVQKKKKKRAHDHKKNPYIVSKIIRRDNDIRKISQKLVLFFIIFFSAIKKNESYM